MVTSHKLARGCAGAYGLIALVGGLIGFLKAGSVASLIAGGLSGALLLLAAGLVARKPKLGLGLGLAVSVLLLGRFASGAVRSGALSTIALVMIVGGAAVLISSVRALTARPA